MNNVPTTPPAGLVWRKARASQGDNDCVYVADDPGNGGRWLDESATDQPPSFVPESSWQAFLTGAKAGEFD
uniref:ORF3 n=1 Tax=Amycolatopsis benzoatilytica TaxID=346045 RepID=A3FG36_9PSEU|nr:ORF3 [Amycolatopsis benzoatilytica]